MCRSSVRLILISGLRTAGVKEANVRTEETRDTILPEQKESGLLKNVTPVFKDKILFSFVAPAQSRAMLIQIFN